MPRPIELVIHMDALRHNCQKMREAARGRFLWAVVKANGYGHGLEHIVKGFAEADGLAILDIGDALKLRRLGWKKRILMIEGFFDEEDLGPIQEAGADVIVHSERLLSILEHHKGLRLGCYIGVNTGMSRLGFRPSEVEAVRARLHAIPGVTSYGVLTHFANGDPSYKENGPATVGRQLDRLGDLANDPEGACLAATTGMLFHPEVKGNAVRAGIALYGVSPDSTVSEKALDIIPAQTLRAKIIAVQHIEKGEAVGYGSKWIAPRPSRIGIVACGYADGYPRSVPNGTPVWVEEKRIPMAGRVCMDMISIDITDYPDADVGSWVELWGQHIPVNEIAGSVGTIGYELICSVLPRVPVRETEGAL